MVFVEGEGEKMDELQEMLEETREISRENNKILRQLRRESRLRQLVSFLYLLVILGSLLYAYYYLQPYLDNITSFYSRNISGEGNGSSTRTILNHFLDQ